MQHHNTCDHCGADCGKHPIIWQEYKFCCNGCNQVFQLLNEHKLNQYYILSNVPGIKTDVAENKGKYAFLDNAEIQQKLYEYHENNLAKLTFYIPVIHCISCIWLLENLTKLHAGVKQSSVNFVKKTCTITFNTEEITLRQLVELLASIHYQPDMSLQQFEGKKKIQTSKALLYKIGVSGFIAGNVMLFALPLYFNGKPLEKALGDFFSYISFILTVPLVFYCGSDYLISAWKAIRQKRINIDLPIALGILTLFVVTCYEVFTHTGQGYSDSLSGLLFFLLLGKWYQSKTYEALSFDRDYKSYFPIAVTKINNIVEEHVLLKNIQVHDLLLIRNKELIPADSVLVDGIGVIDYSFVSGESTPIRKEKGDTLYAGGMQLQGAITVKVIRDVNQSTLTQLWNQTTLKQSATKYLLPIIDRISVIFTISIMFVAIAGFFYWFTKGQFHTGVLVFTAVLIVTCPCALALALPFTFGNSMRLLGHKGVYLKNTQAIESLTTIDTIVFDKTGTITIPDQQHIIYTGRTLTSVEIIAIASLAKQSTHPLSQVLSGYFTGIEIVTVYDFIEISGKGTSATVNEMQVKLGSAVFVGKEKVDDKQSTIFIQINNEVCGYYSIRNKYREGFLDAVLELKKHYKLYLLSGDNDSERETLSVYFDADAMRFNQTPQDKMECIQELQRTGHTVLMAGDGLNDAGAFMQSNLAISVADDIYHFSPASDIIIKADIFYALGKVMQYSKQSLLLVKISFTISFIYNILGLAYALSGTMSPVVAAILMPISSVTVVAFAILGSKVLAHFSLEK